MAPSLSSVSPTSYPASTSSQMMVLLGSDFASGDTLTFFDPQGTSHASGAAKLTVVSSTEIKYQFNDGSDPGTWTVLVNSANGMLHSNSYSFNVAPPSLSSVSPISYPASTSSQTMELFGSNFGSGDTLTFFDPQGTSHASGAAKLTVVSSTEMEYQFNDGGDPGTWTVEVNSPDGTLHSFYSFAVAAPSLSSVSPTSYPASTSSQMMVLLGSDFASGDTLTFFDPQGTSHASGAAKLTVVSSTEIKYQFNDGSDPGTWTVLVNSANGMLHSNSYSFNVAPPSLSSVSPISYPASTSSQTMELFGSNFGSGDTLTFFDPQGTSHASGAAKLTVVSSTEMEYQFNDGGDPGTWTVEVNSPDGTLHSFYSFAVAAPSLSSVSPTSYPASTSSQMMVLLGSNFGSGDTLTFFDPQGTSHASGAAKLTVVSSTEMEYQFNDGGDPGTWIVLVNSPDGTAHSGPYSFTVAPAPAAFNSYRPDTDLSTLEPIAADPSMDILSASYGSVMFSSSTATLILDDSVNFSGTVSGLSGRDAIDLRDIPAIPFETPTYQGTNASGTLTVSDGAHTINIALLGDYNSSSFVASNDGHGGTSVTLLPANQPTLHAWT